MWALQRVAPSRYASGVSPFLRKVKTASGATAVQIAIREGRRGKVIEHLRSAYDDAELAVLLEPGRPKRSFQNELPRGVEGTRGVP